VSTEVSGNMSWMQMPYSPPHSTVR